MYKTCRRCGATWWGESINVCPNCCAYNHWIGHDVSKYRWQLGKKTKTMSDLREYYADYNFPPYEITRFFIDIDNLEPSTYGIYKDKYTKDYIVYYNTETYERKILYQGQDEEYAVKQFIGKIEEVLLGEGKFNRHDTFYIKTPLDDGKKVSEVWQIIILSVSLCISFLTYTYVRLEIRDTALWLIPMVFLLLLLVASLTGLVRKKLKPVKLAIYLVCLIFSIELCCWGKDNGYYDINNVTYFHYMDQWFSFENQVWERVNKPSYDGKLKEYFKGDRYNSSFDCIDFYDSQYYKEHENYWHPDSTGRMSPD